MPFFQHPILAHGNGPEVFLLLVVFTFFAGLSAFAGAMGLSFLKGSQLRRTILIIFVVGAVVGLGISFSLLLWLGSFLFVAYCSVALTCAGIFRFFLAKETSIARSVGLTCLAVASLAGITLAIAHLVHTGGIP